MILDYSRQRVTGETMEHLFDLADAVGLTARCRSLFQGAFVNATERKPVLHHVLRMPPYYNLELIENVIKTNTEETHVDLNQSMRSIGTSSTGNTSSNNNRTTENLDGPALLKEVHAMRKRIQEFAFRVRSGEYVSVTGQHVFKNVIVVATGGGYLGTQCVAEALQADPVASEAAGDFRKLIFVHSPDPVEVYLATKGLNPAETFVLIISNTFAPEDCPVLCNARAVLDWLVRGIRRINPVKKWSEDDIWAKHALAITVDTQASINQCKDFGIITSNIFTIPSWVNLRHSVCSAVGILPLSLQFSYPVMAEFLDGAHDIDEHFFHAPLRDNIPVIMGLLGFWNNTFLGYGCRSILPYSRALHRFPAYVQHVDMESNGKRVALDGTPLLHRSGEIVFGEYDAQFSFFQSLHQGRAVPADFIGFMESQQPTELLTLDGETAGLSNHDELMSHFFAQPDALAYGKTLVDLVQEGVAEPLREHMIYEGNRPSSSLLLSTLDAFSIGQLIALYEHRTAVQGFMWGINSFDAFGVQLGMVLAKHVRAQLIASRKTGASVQGFNGSTSALLDHYLAHAKESKVVDETNSNDNSIASRES
jgi:glucose-6-phosphate isomerase